MRVAGAEPCMVVLVELHLTSPCLALHNINNKSLLAWHRKYSLTRYSTYKNAFVSVDILTLKVSSIFRRFFIIRPTVYVFTCSMMFQLDPEGLRQVASCRVQINL